MVSFPTLSRDVLRGLIPLVILGGGVVGFAALSNQRESPTPVPMVEPIPLVETAAVEANSKGLEVQVDGLVVPYREVALSAEVAGRIAEKSPACRAGRFVKQGTLLFQIDPRDYELEAQRLELEVQQADANLSELTVEEQNTRQLLALVNEELTLEQKQLARVEEVFRRKAASESNLDEARRAELLVRNTRQAQQNQLNMLLTRRARLEQARKLAAAKLEEAQLNLARTKVIAPLDGVVVDDLVEEDSYVQPGTPLVTIDDTSAVEVQCNLRMEELRWIWQHAGESPSTAAAEAAVHDYRLPQLPVTVSYRLGTRQYEWQGVLSHYDGVGLDQRTRTVPCRILVPNPGQAGVRTNEGSAEGAPPALLRGMYVNVRMQTEPEQRLLRVPERAVRPGNVIWQVVDGKLAVEPVQVARLDKDTALIEAGNSKLQPGARVIVSPLASAVEGMPVREKDGQ